MSTAAIKRYWTRVADLGCVICHGPAEIAHCAGRPSVVERIQEPKAKGKKLPRMDWLVLPLCAFHHRTGPDSLDLNPRAFESRYGPVAWLLDRQAERLCMPIWELSQVGRKTPATEGSHG